MAPVSNIIIWVTVVTSVCASRLHLVRRLSGAALNSVTDLGDTGTSTPLSETLTILASAILNMPASNTSMESQGQISTSVSAATSFSSTSTSAAVSASASASGDTGAVVASDSSSCEGVSAACSGDITHYEGGLGACGWIVDTTTDMQIALPHDFMGEQSNGNPYCGRSLTIQNPSTGQRAGATVGDKCMGCTGRSIDLTELLFDVIGGRCDGRCSGFEWWFN